MPETDGIQTLEGNQGLTCVYGRADGPDHKLWPDAENQGAYRLGSSRYRSDPIIPAQHEDPSSIRADDSRKSGARAGEPIDPDLATRPVLNPLLD